MSSLKASDTSRHSAVAAEKAIEFVEARLPEIHDLFSIEKANNAIKEARDAILSVDRAIANVVRASQALDEARASLQDAVRSCRIASERAFSSTPVILSDTTPSEDLVVGQKVIVQNRYRTTISDGLVTDVNDDFVWVRGEIFSTEDHIFVAV